MTSAAQLLKDFGLDAEVNEVNKRLDAAVAQNTRLLEQAEEQQRENYETCEYFRQDIAAKNDQLLALDTKLRELESHYKAETARLEETWEARERVARVTAANVENALKEQISDLRGQLEVLRSFQDERDALHNQIKQLEDANMHLKTTYPEQIRELEMKHLQNEADTKAMYESKLEELRRTAEAEISEQLDASIKRIFMQSLQLKQEVALHVEASSKLQQELTHVAGSKKDLVRNVHLAEQREDEYAKRTAYLSGELNSSKTRVEALEQSVAQLVVEFERQRKALQERAAAELAAAHTETQSLKRMVRLQEQELARIRKRATQLAGGRGMVELFLHTAIQQVRHEIKQSSRRKPDAQAARDRSQQDGDPAQDKGMLASPTRSSSAVLQRYSSNVSGTPKRDPRRSSLASETSGLSGGVKDDADTSNSPASALKQVEQLIMEGPSSVSKSSDVDIRDFTWPERERVLRLLFAQIRGLAKIEPLAPLPPHPLPSVSVQETEDVAPLRGLAALGLMPDLA